MRRLGNHALGALAIAALVAYMALAVAIGTGNFFPANAQQTIGANIDVRPLMDQVVIPVLSAVALAFGSWVLLRVRKWLGVQDNAVLGEMADRALRNGVAYASNLASAKLATAQWTRADVKSQMLKAAIDYVSIQIPGTLRKLGYDPMTAEGRASIERLLLARLDPASVPALGANNSPLPPDPSKPRA